MILGALSGGKHESWEFDSGARDLSPEPNSVRMQHLLQSGGSANSGSLLQLANKVRINCITFILHVYIIYYIII